MKLKLKELIEHSVVFDGVYYYGSAKDFIVRYGLQLRGDLFTQLDIILSRDIIPALPMVIYAGGCVFIVQCFYNKTWSLLSLISPLGDEICLD